MSKKKICIVAPIHIWDDVRVYKKQAVSLAASGFDVTLIARMDAELDGTIQEGVHLVRSKISDKGKIGRIAFIYRVFLQALKCRADIYHLHNPNSIPIVILLSLLSRQVVYDTHEDYSQRLLFREWIPKSFRKLLCWLVSNLEKCAARASEFSIATQTSVVKRLGNNAILIGNSPRYSPDLVEKVKQNSRNIVKSDSFRLVYLGAINESRGISDIVNSLESINKHADTRLWLIGDIPSAYRLELENLPGWSFVDYLGRLEQDSAFAYVSLSDLGLICIHDVGDHAKTDPNKLYEYMSFGVPFVASNFSAWKEKLKSVNAGLFIEPNDPEKLAETIIECTGRVDELQELGRQGVKFVEQNNWSQEFSKLEQNYREVLK
ncbi:hypothetical protein JF50_04080 [Pseudoalteromonas luteoviolacea]|uniref:Glycosyltransferase subfamily 4-like N-terminal domain-containing protein n=1 Tax=Pseudoalteromonas luteoviolacea TaxID=43657 RepID=A0A0C1QBC6_9GAMM|nr:glycosyltransferase [Pseudoalteromonas luteoviolacea]KID57931.1 hypothetical protein JF50_04080 [Pseudoalteromonas luteoviolacea]